MASFVKRNSPVFYDVGADFKLKERFISVLMALLPLTAFAYFFHLLLCYCIYKPTSLLNVIFTLFSPAHFILCVGLYILNIISVCLIWQLGTTETRFQTSYTASIRYFYNHRRLLSIVFFVVDSVGIVALLHQSKVYEFGGVSHLSIYWSGIALGLMFIALLAHTSRLNFTFASLTAVQYENQQHTLMTTSESLDRKSRLSLRLFFVLKSMEELTTVFWVSLMMFLSHIAMAIGENGSMSTMFWTLLSRTVESQLLTLAMYCLWDSSLQIALSSISQPRRFLSTMTALPAELENELNYSRGVAAKIFWSEFSQGVRHNSSLRQLLRENVDLKSGPIGDNGQARVCNITDYCKANIEDFIPDLNKMKEGRVEPEVILWNWRRILAIISIWSDLLGCDGGARVSSTVYKDYFNTMAALLNACQQATNREKVSRCVLYQLRSEAMLGFSRAGRMCKNINDLVSPSTLRIMNGFGCVAPPIDSKAPAASFAASVLSPSQKYNITFN